MKNKYLIAALSLAALLVTGKMAKAGRMDLLNFQGSNGQMVDREVLGDRLLVKAKVTEFPVSDTIWLTCGVQKTADGNVVHDPSADAASVLGTPPWNGGLSFKKIENLPVLTGQTERGSDRLLGVVLKSNGTAIARTCKVDAHGNVLFCNEKEMDAAAMDVRNPITGETLFTAESMLKTATAPLNRMCDVVVGNVGPALSPEEKAKITPPADPNREKAKRTDARLLRLLTKGGEEALLP